MAQRSGRAGLARTETELYPRTLGTVETMADLEFLGDPPAPPTMARPRAVAARSARATSSRGRAVGPVTVSAGTPPPATAWTPPPAGRRSLPARPVRSRIQAPAPLNATAVVNPTVWTPPATVVRRPAVAARRPRPRPRPLTAPLPAPTLVPEVGGARRAPVVRPVRARTATALVARTPVTVPLTRSRPRPVPTRRPTVDVVVPTVATVVNPTVWTPSPPVRRRAPATILRSRIQCPGTVTIPVAQPTVWTPAPARARPRTWPRTGRRPVPVAVVPTSVGQPPAVWTPAATTRRRHAVYLPRRRGPMPVVVAPTFPAPTCVPVRRRSAPAVRRTRSLWPSTVTPAAAPTVWRPAPVGRRRLAALGRRSRGAAVFATATSLVAVPGYAYLTTAAASVSTSSPVAAAVLATATGSATTGTAAGTTSSTSTAATPAQTTIGGGP